MCTRNKINFIMNKLKKLMINLEDKEILVVEDDDMNFIYLKQIFKLTKGNVVRVKTGRAAIEKCKEKTYDIVLMDIQLPDIPGTQATKEIRKFLPDIPILAQTASKSPDELEEIIAAGCNHVMVKPFKFDEFSETIRKFL